MVLFPLTSSLQWQLVVVPAVFSFFSILAVGLRIQARRVANRRLDGSDYWILAALVVSVTYSGLTMAEPIVAGAGLHVEAVFEMYGQQPFEMFLKLGIVGRILWAVSLSLCKVSVLVLYTNVFTVRYFVLISHATAAVIMLWALAVILSSLLICRPVEYAWNIDIPDGVCGDQMLADKVTGSLNIVTDVVVLLLPVPFLARLNQSLYKRLVLIASFTVGLFTTIVSAVRLHAVLGIDFDDITYTITKVSISSAVEPAVAIALACVPLMRPLLGRSQYSQDGTARLTSQDGAKTAGKSTTSHSRSGGPGPAGRVDDSDSGSNVQLRPLGPTHKTEVHVGTKIESLKDHEQGARKELANGHSIGVHYEWVVTESIKQ